MAPFFVAPKDMTSTPDFQVSSAGLTPAPTTALPKRAPSMCSFMPRGFIASKIALTS